MTALQSELLAVLQSPEGRLALENAARVAAEAILRTQPVADDEQLLTVHQAAALRGCSVAAFHKAIQRGQVKVVRAGRSIRVRRREALGIAP